MTLRAIQAANPGYPAKVELCQEKFFGGQYDIQNAMYAQQIEPLLASIALIKSDHDPITFMAKRGRCFDDTAQRVKPTPFLYQRGRSEVHKLIKSGAPAAHDVSSGIDIWLFNKGY